MFCGMPQVKCHGGRGEQKLSLSLLFSGICSEMYEQSLLSALT